MSKNKKQLEEITPVESNFGEDYAALDEVVLATDLVTGLYDVSERSNGKLLRESVKQEFSSKKLAYSLDAFVLFAIIGAMISTDFSDAVKVITAIYVSIVALNIIFGTLGKMSEEVASEQIYGSARHILETYPHLQEFAEYAEKVLSSDDKEALKKLNGDWERQRTSLMFSARRKHEIGWDQNVSSTAYRNLSETSDIE